MIRIRRPIHRVTVRRAATDYIRVEDISSDVLTIRTVKAFEQPAGTFTLGTTFRPKLDGKPLHEALRPNDLVLIELKADYQQRWVPVMLGLVDRAGWRLQMVGERAIREGQIVGRDLGKLLITHNLIWWQWATTDPFFGDPLRNATVLEKAGMRPNPVGTPDQIIDQIVDLLFLRKATLPSSLRGTGTPAVRARDGETWFTDYWRNWFAFTRLPEKTGYNHAKFSPGQGVLGWLNTDTTVWNLITAYADQPWNQVWTDTGDDKMFHVYFRPTPYPSGREGRTDWELVSLYTPDAEAIIGEDLGVSDHDRVNFFYTRLTTDPVFQGQQWGVTAIYPDTAPMEDDTPFHGQLPLIRDSRFMTDWGPGGVPIAERIRDGETTLLKQDSGKSPVVQMMRLKTGLLQDWFQPNPTFVSGTVTLAGDPAVRVGQRLYYAREKLEFFIVGVQQNYSWGQNQFTTTLNVVRGAKRV
jgi:hypothetical protein